MTDKELTVEIVKAIIDASGRPGVAYIEAEEVPGFIQSVYQTIHSLEDTSDDTLMPDKQ